MKKKALLAVLLVMTLLLSSCSLLVKDELKDAQSVILKMGDTEITKAEVQSATNSVLYEMYQYYYMNGVDLDVTDPDVIASAQSSAIEELKEDMVLHAKAEELGLDQLTEEETAQMQETVQSNMDYARTYVQSYMLTDTELEGEELEKAIQESLDQLGVSQEYYEESAKESIIHEKLENYAIKDVTVSDEEIKADYDEKVAADEEKYKEDASSWASADRNGTTLYYTPAGIRRVKQILLRFKEEDQTAIDDASAVLTEAVNKSNAAQELIANAEAILNDEEASQEDKDNAAKDLEAAQADYDAAKEELKTAQANYDAVKTTAFANLDEDADAVLAALAEDPDSWDQLVEEKNEDPGMQAGSVNAENGYAVFEGMTDFDSVFVEAAMALQSVGDISGKVRGESYGYYILKYVGDEAEGPVDYDSVKDAIHDTLLSSKQDEVYTQTVQDWIAAAGIKEDLGALND